MGISSKIKRYRFEDTRRLIRGTIFGNLILAIILILPNINNLWESTHVHMCLITAVGVFVVNRIYDWKSSRANLVILGLYLLLVFLEYMIAGLPSAPVQIDVNNHRISKGIMFDLVVIILPALYLAARIFLSISLLWIVKYSSDVEEEM
ncbi:MAG: hypothetical protein R2824_21895 [Saprospiraceae bacterium]